MSEKTMKENMQAFAVKQILKYLDEDPDKSLPKLLAWALPPVNCKKVRKLPRKPFRKRRLL